MTLYNVHIYREMRLAFEGIEADTPEAAAAIARDGMTSDANDIDDCDGEDFAALVDVIGDDEFEKSVTIDFEAERLRKAAPNLLEALELFLKFNDQWLITTDAQANLEHNRVMHIARTAVATATVGGVMTNHIDIHATLEDRRQIAVIWSIEDVQAVRPDFTDEQCWEVLQAARHYHDATVGINWDVLRCHADMVVDSAASE